jgi:riboflavin synthase alpha subunit
MEHTNLSRVRARDRVNLEVDMVGKYVVRAVELAGLHLRQRPGEVTQ